MRKIWFCLVPLLLLHLLGRAQVGEGDDTAIDRNYLEDQFYIGFSYNYLVNPNAALAFSQRNFSYNLQAGLIKDIPLNVKRNFGLGLGLGLAANSYYSNVLVEQTTNGRTYGIPEAIDFNRGKFETFGLELPFELRFRNSNPTDYRFWRIYLGAKLSYHLSSRSKYVDDTSKESFKNEDLNAFGYGLTLSAGYNTFNVHLYYGLNQLLDDSVEINGQSLRLRPIRIGVIFYIL